MLANRIVLVTGASRGIGWAIARLFASHGAHVVLSGRDASSLEAAAQRIRESCANALLSCQVLDVTQPDSVKQAFQVIAGQFKRLDVLVSNAGVLEGALLGMVSAASLQRTFETNTFGSLYCAQYASRLMARQRSGSIINLTSIVGTHGHSGQAAYSASKAAVIGLTKSLAKELAPQNIRVNAIAPGFIDTDMARSANTEKFDGWIDSIAMGRIGSPDEVAQVALFLASDMSSYVTGQIIGVDGGMRI